MEHFMARVKILLLIVGCFTLTGCVTPMSFSAGASSPLQALENSLLFHPKTADQRWFDLPPHVKVEEVWLKAVDGERIHGWWFGHPESTGAVLFCHGNAGNLSQWAPRMVALQQALRKSVLIFDYPGYGKSSGQPSEKGCYAAGDAAYTWLQEDRMIPAKNIILCGESLGGGVATELAVRRPHRALVLIRTFTSVPDMAKRSMLTYSSASLVRNQFDNLSRMPRCPAPVFLAHGDRDQLIPLAQAKQLYEATPGPKELFIMENCGHNEPYPHYFYTSLWDFLDRNPEKK
jgi:fermentation-respiration switch protein FrsA (DUF1100 family)